MKKKTAKNSFMTELKNSKTSCIHRCKGGYFLAPPPIWTPMTQLIGLQAREIFRVYAIVVEKMKRA